MLGHFSHTSVFSGRAAVMHKRSSQQQLDALKSAYKRAADPDARVITWAVGEITVLRRHLAAALVLLQEARPTLGAEQAILGQRIDRFVSAEALERADPANPKTAALEEVARAAHHFLHVDERWMESDDEAASDELEIAAGLAVERLRDSLEKAQGHYRSQTNGHPGGRSSTVGSDRSR